MSEKIREALAFAASVIKSGEPWTDECERIIGAALSSPSEYDEGLVAGAQIAETDGISPSVIAAAIRSLIGTRSGGERGMIVANGWAVVDGDMVQVHTVGPTRRSAIVNYLYVNRGHRITEAHDDLAIEKIWQAETKFDTISVLTVRILADAIESGAHLTGQGEKE